MLNPETMSKDQTKKEFARFVEDFNTGSFSLSSTNPSPALTLHLSFFTATLPHEKFYHMEAYEKRMNALRSGDYIPPPEDSYDPTADMRDLQSKHKRTAVEHESYLNKDQLQQLRRVQQERIEVRCSLLFVPFRPKHNCVIGCPPYCLIAREERKVTNFSNSVL